MDREVYLDHNATTPLRAEAREAMLLALDRVGNPSSVHRHGRLSRRLVEDAREAVAGLVGARPELVVFTSGGTEANSLAISGTGRRALFVSGIEHDSVLAAAPEARRIPVTRDGLVDIQALPAMLAEADGPALVSVMLANNETGVVQPVEAVVAAAREAGALVHCDAAQAAGKIPVDFAALGVDMLTLSAHKMGGPPGVGALVVADAVALAPLIRGGGQERGRRAGTEPVPAIAGFAAVARIAGSALDAIAGLAPLRDSLEERARAIAPGIRTFGATAPRLANTSCIAMPGVPADTQVMALDLAGVAISAGSACSSGKVRPSHVLSAMGIDPGEAACAIRVSLGWTSRPEDVDRFVEVWTALHARTVGRDRPAIPAA